MVKVKNMNDSTIPEIDFKYRFSCFFKEESFCLVAVTCCKLGFFALDGLSWPNWPPNCLQIGSQTKRIPCPKRCSVFAPLLSLFLLLVCRCWTTWNAKKCLLPGSDLAGQTRRQIHAQKGVKSLFHSFLDLVAFLCLSMATLEDLKHQNMSTSKHYLHIKIAIDFGLFAKLFLKVLRRFGIIFKPFKNCKKLLQ